MIALRDNIFLLLFDFFMGEFISFQELGDSNDVKMRGEIVTEIYLCACYLDSKVKRLSRFRRLFLRELK